MGVLLKRKLFQICCLLYQCEVVKAFRLFQNSILWVDKVFDWKINWFDHFGVLIWFSCGNFCKRIKSWWIVHFWLLVSIDGEITVCILLIKFDFGYGFDKCQISVNIVWVFRLKYLLSRSRLPTAMPIRLLLFWIAAIKCMENRKKEPQNGWIHTEMWCATILTGTFYWTRRIFRQFWHKLLLQLPKHNDGHSNNDNDANEGRSVTLFCSNTKFIENWILCSLQPQWLFKHLLYDGMAFTRASEIDWNCFNCI